MNTEMWLGLITGIIFGVFLQKGRVLRFEKQIGALLFKDMTIVKFMLSAILVGMVGILSLAHFEFISLHHKSMNVGGVIIGATLFGVGWAMMGFCPGTAVGALGEGRWHALFAVIGMLIGAMIYAELYPHIASSILSWRNLGNISLTDVIKVPTWGIVLTICAGILFLCIWFEKKKL